MTDKAETSTLPPFKLAVAAGTAVLCGVIIYNAVAGQDGRQRDVLSRLSDLEQHASLPVTIGVGAFDGRPTTKSMVTLEQLAEIAANADQRDVLAAEVGSELGAIEVYSGLTAPAEFSERQRDGSNCTSIVIWTKWKLRM